MILFEYQEKAVKSLFEKTEEALDFYEVRKSKNKAVDTKTIHFTSPTGSGKTIMSFALMNELVQMYDNLVFVWIAPNTLHTQSLDKFDKLVDAISSPLNPIDSDGIESDNMLHENDILCLNWSSLDKKNNTLIRENESGKYIDNIMHLTREDGKIIIALIDESHIASQNDTTKAYEFLRKLNPTVKLEITATPKKMELGDENVEVPRQEVVDAGVIKKQFVFNAFEDSGVDNKKLVKYAYDKLQEITQKYNEYTNGKIIPLMIIQIENEKTDDYNRVKHEIERHLTDIGINVSNEVAYYLSEDKDKSENLAENNNPIQIVFTKTAIATGWDCPRASVLLTFRKSNDDKFKTQVLGRINRMPELKHYGEELLDSAYVFANVSKYIPDDPTSKYAMKTVEEVEQETVPMKDELKGKISLPFLTKAKVIDNYYNSEYDMKDYVVKKCKEFVDVVTIQIENVTNDIIKNLKVESLGEIQVAQSNADYILTPNEIENIISSKFVQNGYESISISQKKQPALFNVEINLTPFETINLLKILKSKLEEKANHELTYLEIYKVILQQGNYENFISMLSDIKNISSKKRLARLQKEVLFEEMSDSITWSPEKSFICNSKLLLRLTKKSIYTKDCIKDFNKTERRFVALLETMSDVSYWYRNGSRGDYFRIPYKKENTVREFYPDFIVGYENGQIGIYDTKSEMTASDGEAKDKAEYLYTYCEKFGFKNGLIKIEEKGDVNYFRINQRENYKNYDDNKVEWEDFGTLTEDKNIFKDLEI